MKTSKKEVDFNDFNIFEALKKGKTSVIFENKKIPLLTVSSIFIILGQSALNKIRAKIKDQIVIAEKDGLFYIAVLPFTSNLKGYEIRKILSKDLFYINSKATIARGFKKGVYLINDVVFSNGIDFFELTIFDKNNYNNLL